MKVYSYCAIGNDKSNTTRVLSGIGAFSSENVSRKYVTDNFFTTYGFYPQHVEISSVRRSLLQTLLNSICEDED